MIAQLSGAVVRTTASFVVLDVQGVGYKVFVPLSVLENLPGDGHPLTLVTHTLVREDELSLFGFFDDAELRIFEQLLSVSGVGPKVALALLSALPARELAEAVAGEDVRTLTRVPGIGAKTAQRLVLELKDKIAAVVFEMRASGGADKPVAGAPKKSAHSDLDDAVSALINLGYNKAEAARAAQSVLDERSQAGETIPPEFAALLRAALNRLTKK